MDLPQTTRCLCDICHAPIDGLICVEAGSVLLRKSCPRHGDQAVLLSTDVEYYRASRTARFETRRPLHFATPVERGCFYDCGLCTDHLQHSAMAIVEILDECNMSCPTCIAGSRPGAGNIRTVPQVDFMLDTIVRAEGVADLVMISGGEPTIHESVCDIIALACGKNIRRVMLITNGLRIANDMGFVRQLSRYSNRLEIYLQFDSLTPSTLRNIRGEDLSHVRQRALDNLESVGLHSTLVCVVKKSVNIKEVEQVIDYALTRPFVRGVTFQPCKITGRNDNFEVDRDYVTLSEVRTAIIGTSRHFREDGLVPHPVNPEQICIGYLRQTHEGWQPATRDVFNLGPDVRSAMYFLPDMNTEAVQYERLFRVAIVSILDQFNFTIDAVKRSCIHFATTEGKLIPIDTYYMFYQNQHDSGSRNPPGGPPPTATRLL